ncbi:MAG: steryl acetyl hydrolase [Ruminococcaceae bacterium]|nr:steryl acetyl hydrolase [Oscillospiraceae bacterium]
MRNMENYTEFLNSKTADISVFYKTVEHLKLPLQVFLPDNFDENCKYKTVIAIHGGGWRSLKETPDNWNGGWMANNAKYYARKGYVGIVFSYRDLEFGTSNGVGKLIEDCKDALNYMAEKFLFIDRQNVLLMGDSAGGHLALCLCMGLLEGEKPVLKPGKIAAYNPVTDCVCEKWSYCASDAVKYSPLDNTKLVDAEILVMHGTADDVVSIDDSRFFVEKMKEKGNNISLVEFPDANHAFILFGYTAEEKNILKALKITDQYFNL